MKLSKPEDVLGKFSGKSDDKKVVWGNVRRTPPIRKVDVHSFKQENLNLKEELRQVKEKLAAHKDSPISYLTAYSQTVRPTTDADAMRVEGYQPLPTRGAIQRIMMGDGTNPFVRY